MAQAREEALFRVAYHIINPALSTRLRKAKVAKARVHAASTPQEELGRAPRRGLGQRELGGIVQRNVFARAASTARSAVHDACSDRLG